jgi:hypothetical protein
MLGIELVNVNDEKKEEVVYVFTQSLYGLSTDIQAPGKRKASSEAHFHAILN